MFQQILLPLDGSRLAEAALPAAVHLALNLGASLTLIHVIECQAPPAVHGERHLTQADEARAYLDEFARRAVPAGLPVARHVHAQEVEDVAESLVEHVRELAPDLIVMCTHGRGGLRSLMFGSVAQRRSCSSGPRRRVIRRRLPAADCWWRWMRPASMNRVSRLQSNWPAPVKPRST